MRKDHRPYYIKKKYLDFQRFYVKKILKPQFDSLGKGYYFLKPWHVELFGDPISMGDYSTIIAESDNKVRISVWSDRKNPGGIRIGNYCLISPGVRISAADEIVIEDSCMLANGVYVTDSDWHGLYDRCKSHDEIKPVHLEKNVWVGDSAIICKGVKVGENSIIGAGSVVTKTVPPNVIAAGNPAKTVKKLNPNRFVTRETLFENNKELGQYMEDVDRSSLAGNTFLYWLKTMINPEKKD